MTPPVGPARAKLRALMSIMGHLDNAYWEIMLSGVGKNEDWENHLRDLFESVTKAQHALIEGIVEEGRDVSAAMEWGAGLPTMPEWDACLRERGWLPWERQMLIASQSLVTKRQADD